MHFKIAIIFCAVYFIAPAWSTGLSMTQVKSVIEEYNNQIQSESKDPIGYLVKHFQIKNFELNSSLPVYVEFEKFVWALANDKDIKHDISKDDRVMPPKNVGQYIVMFNWYAVHNKGVISGIQCAEFVVEFILSMEETEKKTKKEHTAEQVKIIADQLIDALKKDDINLAEFLEIMISYELGVRKSNMKTISTGISRAQVRLVIEEYNNQIQSESKDPIGYLVKHFQIYSFKLDSNEPVYKQLEKFFLAFAHDRIIKHDISQDDRLMPPEDIELYIAVFNTYETINEGVITGKQFTNFANKFMDSTNSAEEQTSESLEKIVFELIHSIATEEINLAKFLEIMMSFEIDIEKRNMKKIRP